MNVYEDMTGLKVKEQFEYAYYNKIWERNDIVGTICGAGSTKKGTRLIKISLKKFIDENNIKSIVDYGCGDCAWMYEVMENIEYIGVDLVRELTEINQVCYPMKTYLCNDIDDMIPHGDIVFIRDVLEHLCLDDCRKIIKKAYAARPDYIMLSIYHNTKYNSDTKALKYRKRNYMIEPFNMREPDLYLDDGHMITDRKMGVWKV